MLRSFVLSLSFAALTLVSAAAPPTVVSAGAGTADFPVPLRASYFHPQRVIDPSATPAEQTAAIRTALDRFQGSGLNAIFPYFTGSSGQAYYLGAIHKTRVYGDQDPLAVLFAEARLRGIQVYPVLCVTVCGNDQPDGILKEHPEWGLRHPDGTPLGYLSPAHPEARAWLVSVAQEIVTKYRPEGILLDYIRYHNRPLILDESSEQRFTGGLPEGVTPEQRTQLQQKFREDELTELVRMYRETINAAAPGTRLGIYSWGPHVAANHQIAQCWPRWVTNGYLDFVNVSGYYHHDKYGDKYLQMFEDKMRAAVKLNQDTGRPVPLSFAVGLVTSHGKVHSADDVRIYLKSAATIGLDGYIMFTWGDLLQWLNELDRSGELRLFPKVRG